MEVTYIYQFRPDKNAVIGRPERGDGQIAHGIDVMVEIAKRFEDGRGSTSIRDLGAILSLSQSQINGIISDLESANLIIPINVNRSVYMLSKPSSKIKVTDIIDAIFVSDSEKRGRKQSKGKALVKVFFEKGVKGEGRTLLDLIKEEENDNR